MYNRIRCVTQNPFIFEEVKYMGKKIIVVEDDVKIASLLRINLERQGYQVLFAHDGQSGYELIEKESPDLIITDLLLPHLHGFELCKKVKENNKLKRIPIILMTAVYKKSKYKMQGKTYGADDFIEKPFDLPILLSKINKLIPPSD